MKLTWAHAAAFLLASAASQASPLGLASPYNVFSFGNASFTSDVGSRVAIGGQLQSNLTLGNHPFSDPSAPYFLVLENGLNGKSVTQNTGGNVYSPGYSTSGPGHIQIQNGTGSITTSGPTPIDFDAAKTELVGLSNTIDAIATAQGIRPVATTDVVLNATGSEEIVYFQLTAQQFANLAQINTNGHTVIINVTGAAQDYTHSAFYVDALGQQPSGDSTIAQKILFNFNDATSLRLNSSIGGAVLAPFAHVTGTAQVNGQFIVNSINFQGEIHGAPFRGSVPQGGGEVPEPATYALCGAGLVAVVLARRKR